MGKNNNIWVPRELLESVAFTSLKKPASYKVLFRFFMKRQCVNTNRRKKTGNWQIANNGQIEFCYTEAVKHLGISKSTFGASVKELEKVGLIDVAAMGQGVHKTKTLYAISERWKLYGMPNYIPPKQRPQGPVNRGFQKGNQFGRRCKRKS